ncbi:MAG: radical SAM protein [Syntrophorhabdaceae bacterium]|nr:radical SAM protein [Syntrophorhabdaceae bacterium]
MKTPRALAINPYVYDFAAYNFWSSPLGLLYIAGILRQNGFHVDLVDCMSVREEKRKADGRAPYRKQKVPRPDALRGVRKSLRRYGMPPEELAAVLEGMESPDIILITSIMTYWYVGTMEVVDLARRIHPRSRIAVGGIYPTLCHEQAVANFRAADLVVPSGALGLFYGFIENRTGKVLAFKPVMDDLNVLPYPAFDLCDSIPFVPLLTSLGCAFHCTYCATSYIYPGITRRSVDSVVEEIRHWHERGVHRFVFYDDSLLYRSKDYAKPLLKRIASLPFAIDIYNPNALNAAFIDDETAALCARCGFREVRIGLESVNPAVQAGTGGKVTRAVFEKALTALKRAGYSKEGVTAYILAGLPGQPWQEVKEGIDYLKALEVTPHIAEYTPIPHTPMFETYKEAARFPIADDAIYQNNALFPYAWEGFTEEDLNYLKRYAKE